MLAGAALLARSLGRLQGDDIGFDRQHVLAVSFTPDWARDTTAQMLTDVAQRMQRRLASIPGIVASTPLVVPPMVGTGVWQVRFTKPGQSNDQAASNPTISGDVIGPGYFRTFGIPIVRGRAFTDADDGSAPLVMIVNESFARLYWPNEDALGKQLRMPGAAGTVGGGNGWRTVVGVAKDAHIPCSPRIDADRLPPSGPRILARLFRDSCDGIARGADADAPCPRSRTWLPQRNCMMSARWTTFLRHH